MDAKFNVETSVANGKVVEATVTGPFHSDTLDLADGWWVVPGICAVFDSRGLRA